MSLVRKHFDFDGISFECCAIVTPDNQVYWKLSNFSDLLGYFEPHRACKLVDDKFKFKWSQLSQSYPECGYWHPNTIFVSEPGIYSLIFRSRSIFAKKFMHRVIEVVLPAILETGQNPNIATSQANSLIETLRQTLLEKERALTETREALTTRERAMMEIQTTLVNQEIALTETREALTTLEQAMMEIQTTLVNQERTLTETRGALEEKNRMLAETRGALEEKNRILENEMQQTRQLQNDIETVRSKVSVSPKRKSVRYVLCVYQHENTYKFIRAQKRSLKKSCKRIPDEFKLVYLINDVGNPFHILNKLKESLPLCKVRYTTITTDANVLELLKELLFKIPSQI